MTLGLVVSNSSPLLALAQIGLLDLLRQLHTTVLMPPAVARESTPSIPVRPHWLVEQPLGGPLDPRVLRASLHPGEREALTLAMERSADWVVLDERSARSVAEALGHPVVGAIGVLIQAKRHGLLPLVRPSLDALLATGFYAGPNLYRRVLAGVGEASGLRTDGRGEQAIKL